MATIDIDDTTFYYERSGEGPGVLFIHGMCGSADVWAEQARRLSDRYSCVRYDRRGHTRSAWGTAAISDAQHADDAARLIEALHLAPCLVIGSSGGAAIATDLVVRHGHLLRGAALSEPPLFSLDPRAGRSLMGDVLPSVEEAMASGGTRAAVDAFFEVVCPGLWLGADEAKKDMYRDNGEVGFADLESPSLDTSARDLAAVGLPVLVMTGTGSHPAFGAVARALARSLPDARLVEIEGSGHVTYTEQPDAFAEAISVFATEIDRRKVPTR